MKYSFFLKWPVYMVGCCVHLFNKAHALYMNERIAKKLGGASVQFPYKIAGIDNMICGESVSIGKNAVIMCTRSKLIIEGHFVSGPNLTVVAGNHMAVVGRYLDTVTDEMKDATDMDRKYDQDICIEKDVWVGANVTILKGVTIGRGCIIAAGSVVTKTMPPYCIIAGVPAKPLKVRWTIDQILEHERSLYIESERLSKDYIEILSDKYKINCDC